MKKWIVIWGQSSYDGGITLEQPVFEDTKFEAGRVIAENVNLKSHDQKRLRKWLEDGCDQGFYYGGSSNHYDREQESFTFAEITYETV